MLAEHGGPYVFSAEDYKRRVKWGEAAGKAADALCVSGNHKWDRNPNRVEFEPHLQTAKPGQKLQAVLRLNNSSAQNQTVTVRVCGRGVVADGEHSLTANTSASKEQAIDLSVAAGVKPRRYIIASAPRIRAARSAATAFLRLTFHRVPSMSP